MSVVAALPLQLDTLGLLPSAALALLVIAVVVFVVRAALSVAWRLVIVAAIVAVALWIRGLLGPLSSFLPL